MAKHRGTVFAVVRKPSVYNAGDSSHIIGVYLTAERADEVAAASMQKFKESQLDKYYTFEVQATTYYDE